MYLVGEQQNPIGKFDDLLEYFREANKPESRWRVGTEYEMIGVRASGDDIGHSIPYEGEQGIGAILEGLVAKGWQAVREGENIIALTCRDSQVSIEPGGQLEHAARPHASTADLEDELRAHLGSIEASSGDANIAWLSVGFRPWGRIEDVAWMPKHRYEVMRDYLPTRGALAREMMKRTATVQVNLDYKDELDAHRKMRASMSVTSILTALYANSPIVDGKVTEYQSYRSHVWTATDPDRCGQLPFVFEDGDFFSMYSNWALDVPMFFVQRDRYIPAGGMTFRQFLAEGFHGHRPTMDDWGLHLSTLFPDARIKKFLEVRGCDANSIAMTLALGALVRGYLYDEAACEAAIGLTAGLSFDQRLQFARDVSRLGLAAKLPGTATTAQELAQELLAIARDGLSRKAPAEIAYLEPVDDVAQSGRTHATALVELWNRHRGEPAPVIESLRYF